MNDMPHRVLTHDTGPPEPDRARPYRSGAFGVLDIGTTKIACLIARVDSDGELRVLGCDWRQGLGVRGGSIVDLEKAERAIRACVGQAENMADVRLRDVIVNLTCGQPDSQIYNVKWGLDAPAEGRPVTDHDAVSYTHLVTIRLARGFSTIAIEPDGVIAGAAALDLTVAETAAAAGLTGLEFLSGIPGTIGGAVAMNAGAYGGEMAHLLSWAECVTRDGERRRLSSTDLAFGYRHANVPPGSVITRARLAAKPGATPVIAAKMAEIRTAREESQPCLLYTSRCV